MPTLNHKLINLAPLITTILLASIAPGCVQTANVKIADSQSTNQQPSTNEAPNNQACITTKVQEDVSKLGTLGLTNTDFEALVKCGTQAVPALSQALKSDRVEVRASAAYALGQIGQAAYAAVPNLVMVLRDDSSNDVRAIVAYTLGRIGSKAEAAVPELIVIFENPDEDSVVHKQATQALNKIDTQNAFVYRRGFLVSHGLNVEEDKLPNTDLGAPLSKVGRKVKSSTNSPLVCQIPGIKSILPRCK
jgi:HEAT repeats